MSNKKHSMQGDIHDNPKDQKYLQGDKAILDLPEVKDIPGQENFNTADLPTPSIATSSSADEEGKGILEEVNDNYDETNVTVEEREILEQSAEHMDSKDETDQQRAMLDNTDEDGDPLNVASDVSGDDLDVPGAEEDDANEELGEEDEENNSYSLGADKKD